MNSIHVVTGSMRAEQSHLWEQNESVGKNKGAEPLLSSRACMTIRIKKEVYGADSRYREVWAPAP